MKSTSTYGSCTVYSLGEVLYAPVDVVLCVEVEINSEASEITDRITKKALYEI